MRSLGNHNQWESLGRGVTRQSELSKRHHDSGTDSDITELPARLLVFDTNTGNIVQTLPAVGDCDDVFYDKTRKRIYASGGDGRISVFQEDDADHYWESARIATVKGARTSFFSPELDRLFLAVRRQGSQSAAIRVFVPAQ